jgi:hypothetical protein
MANRTCKTTQAEAPARGPRYQEKEEDLYLYYNKKSKRKERAWRVENATDVVALFRSIFFILLL